MRSGGWTPIQSEWCPYKKRTVEKTCTRGSPGKDTGRRWSSTSQVSLPKASEETNPADVLASDFWPPEFGEDNLCCPLPQPVELCDSSLSRLTQSGKGSQRITEPLFISLGPWHGWGLQSLQGESENQGRPSCWSGNVKGKTNGEVFGKLFIL